MIEQQGQESIPPDSRHHADYSSLTFPPRKLLSGVLQGDCLKLLPTIPTSSVDCIFVDPPYNIGIDYGSGSRADRLTPAEYLYQMEQLTRSLAGTSRTVLNSPWRFSPGSYGRNGYDTSRRSKIGAPLLGD